MAEFKKMNSIQQTAKRCKEENIGISAANIRALVQEGRIPYVIAGTKKLINWDVLMEYLRNGFVAMPDPAKMPTPPRSEWGKIYEIPARLPDSRPITIRKGASKCL